MLTDTLTTMVNNPFKKNYEKKKKQLMYLQFFPFPIKIVSKLS